VNKLELPVAIIGGQDLGELETTLVRQPSVLEQKQRIEALQEKFQGVRSPDELDAATKKEGMPAFLLNFHFATQADLSWMGLGQAMHIPVQIDRKSVV